MLRFILATMITATLPSSADNWIDLWPGQAPGAEPLPEGSETVTDEWRYTDIEKPQYPLYRADGADGKPGQGLVILPGGGYTILAAAHEGAEIGEWCLERGITAMVVKYRVSGKDSAGYQFPVPQMDARRAIRTMRSKAGEWNVDPAQIGIMGASAGGHLAATCATLFEEEFEAETNDAIDKMSCRPDFSVLLYPVIAMDEPWAHRGSARRLLGENPDEKTVKMASPHLHVSEKTPPVFIVHASNDSGVPLRNSAEYMSACAKHNVPVRASIYPTGGHGFGFKGRGAAKGWIERLDEWLQNLRKDAAS
jgi:acetyl esterase/lipase